MSGHFVIRPRAQRDLADIWYYTKQQWGQRQAEAYIRQIKDAVLALADNPDLGRACDEVQVGYRKSQVGTHVMFYRKVGDGIEIVRILHERMDYKRNL